MKLRTLAVFLSVLLVDALADKQTSSTTFENKQYSVHRNLQGEPAVVPLKDKLAFLMDYQLQLVSCTGKTGEQMLYPETGIAEDNVVVFRLCPIQNANAAKNGNGCDCGGGGYGEYVVLLHEFVRTYLLEDQSGDYSSPVNRYADCQEYHPPKENDIDNDETYYIGSACSSDGMSIKLQLYQDEACTVPVITEDATFEEISTTVRSGWNMPYENGGLVLSDQCMSCTDYNNKDNSGGTTVELRDMCMDLYDLAGKCETQMETFHEYGHEYGTQEGSCNYIHALSNMNTTSATNTNGAGTRESVTEDESMAFTFQRLSSGALVPFLLAFLVL